MFGKFSVIRLFAYTPSIKFIGSRSKIPHHSHAPSSNTQQKSYSSAVSHKSNYQGVGSSIFLSSLRYPQLTE